MITIDDDYDDVGERIERIETQLSRLKNYLLVKKFPSITQKMYDIYALTEAGMESAEQSVAICREI